MQIVIDIPEEEFGTDIKDKFQDFFKRIKVEIKHHMITGTDLVCGAYELETIEMFMRALANSTPQPKTGHWIYRGQDIYECSECGENHHGNYGTSYCEKCGTRMR